MTEAQIRIRTATRSDLKDINDIYNHYVLYAPCTFQEDIETMENREKWFDHHEGNHLYPVYVAEMDESGKTVTVGWGSLSMFRERSAYRFTVEDSIYIHHDHLGKGIGKILLETLMIYVDANEDIHCVIASITSHPTTVASEKLHSRFKFVKVAHFKEIGKKFNEWLDVVYYQYSKPL